MDRKKFNKDRTVIVLLLTIVVFFLGIAVASLLNVQKLDHIADLSKELQQKSLELEVEYSILEENLCSSKDVLSLTDELYDLSEKASYMENMYGYDDERIIELKSYYFALEAKHWLLAKNRNEVCGADNYTDKMNSSTILYFYSNEKDCDSCEEQGVVLSYLRRKYTDLKVYSFDINYNSSIVSVLKSVYDVHSSPAIVLNEETLIGFKDVDELIGLANAKDNVSLVNSTDELNLNNMINSTQINSTESNS